MSETDRTEAVAEETVEATSEIEEASPKRKRKKWPIVVGVVVVVLAAAGAGLWVWHEQPSFCGAICHTPMDPYLETWNNEPDSEGVDKYGNTVSNTNSMLVVTHKLSTEDGGAGATCLSCHVPQLSEQITEAINWVTGSYEATVVNDEYRLLERTLEDLVEARGIDEEEFCLNDSCHHVSSQTGEAIESREDLIEATSYMTRNVHISQHSTVSCSECHKAHRASVVYCTQCHSDVEVPDGWLTYQEAASLAGVS